jgi:hypothetical protein
MIFLSQLKHQRPPEGEGIRLALYQGERPVGTPVAVDANNEKLEEIGLLVSRRRQRGPHD